MHNATNAAAVRHFGMGLALCVALLPASVRAQGAPTAATGATDLEEIVVTATRRSESLSKVPVSVTALSQDAMDDRGIKDFQDIARYTPGISIDQTGTNAISIRGISSSGGAGTTGIYIDDTPIQMRALGFNPDDTLPKTFDLDRVEVLRGPQGTLFGAGSEGGTVRYLLTPPKLTGSSTYLRSEVAYTQGGAPSYEIGIAHGFAPVDGVLGIRVGAWYRGDGGWIDRVDPTTRGVTASNANYGSSYLLRLAAVWRPTSALTITPSVIYQNSDKHDESTFWAAYSNPSSGKFSNATPERMPVPDKYLLPSIKFEANLTHSQVIGTVGYYSRDETTAYQGTIYDMSYYESIGWVNNPNNPNGSYYSNTPVPLNCGSGTASVPPCDWYPLIDDKGLHLPAGFSDYQTPNTVKNQQHSWNAEVRWQSSDDASRWRWTVGAFWQQARELSLEQLKDANINQFFTFLYGQDAASIFGDFYNCNGVGSYFAIPACDIYYNRNETVDRQIAAFGELSYALTDRLRVTIGERIARTSFSLNHYADGYENFGPPRDANGNPLSAVYASNSETPNTPKLTLAYQHDPANLFYATYAKGFRVGGGNAPLPPYCSPDLDSSGYPHGAPLTYKSDSTQSYEIGSKNSFGPDLRIASSVYYIRWNDIQQNVYIGGGCGLQFTANLGTAVAKGFDVQAEINAGPMRFELAAGYTDARYTSSSSPPGTSCPSSSTNPCLPLALAGDAISGEASINQSPGLNAPWTASLGAEYDFKIGANPALLRFDYQYEGRNNWPSTLQDPGTSQFNAGTYTLSSSSFLQARAAVKIGGWNVAAFIDNLLDSHTILNYQLSQIDAYAAPFPIPGQEQNQYSFRPRTFGLTAIVHL